MDRTFLEIYTMDIGHMRTEILLRAIALLWPELPDLVKDDWADFEDRLGDLLAQLERELERAPVIRALILDLFARYSPAHRRLITVMGGLERPQGVFKGLGRSISDLLAELRYPLVTRYTDITCPRRVWVETPRVAVTVRLTVRPSGLSDATEALRLRAEAPLQVWIDAPGFAVLDGRRRELVVPQEGDSPVATFHLHPLAVGPTHVSFDFLQGGNPVSTAGVPVEIGAREVAVSAAPHFSRPLHFEPGVAPPQRMPYVAHERVQATPTLRFSLFLDGELQHEFEPVILEGNLADYAARLYARLTQLTDHRPGSSPDADAAQEVEQEVRTLGRRLWLELIPAGLKAVYAQEREAWQDCSFLVVSDEPHVPWELVWPYSVRGEWADEVPWCVHMCLARWLRRGVQGDGHLGPRMQLRWQRWACLAPTDSDLLAVQEERALLGRMAAELGLSDLGPASPTLEAVRALLAGGEYEWLHVASHGRFSPAAPGQDSAIWLEGRRPLTPDDLIGPEIQGHIGRRRPVFFFNACHGGRQAWSLTGLGGWAERLIGSGAGLFLAPLWTVTDEQAVVFAGAVYARLRDGETTVAQAVRAARLAARRDGDPTWLAYSLYAHPNARVALGHGPGSR